MRDAQTAPSLQILVVDDNRTAAEAIAHLLRREQHEVEVRYDGQSAIDRLAARRFDLVLTDLRMTPVDGLAVVHAARASDPPVDTIVFTAYGSVEAAVSAMRLGALDFLTKPVTADQILQRVRNFRRSPAIDATIVGASQSTQALHEQARQLALVRSTVLISGETGTGRRHLARWLHEHGLDTNKPLLTLLPQRFPSTEDIQQAGTLLIAGVDDWSNDAQEGLLRLLETLEAGKPPRIIATASPQIDMRAATGEVPPELYFRLAVLVVKIPPLRERPVDIPPLLEHFLTLHAHTFGKDSLHPNAQQLASLSHHAWPGNVRELANLAERAVVLGSSVFDMTIKPARQPEATLPTLAEGFNLPDHLETIERTLLVRAIDQTDGDRPAMGRLLGLERNTLRYKLNKYGLLDRT